MKEVIVSLMIWISQHTGLAYDPNHIPDVHQVTSSELASIMFSGQVPVGYNEGRLLGLFQHDKDKIYIAESIDLDSIYGRSVLLHELVHFMQFANGRHKAVACQKQLERLAYEVQSKYLAEQRHQPAFSNRHIVVKSECERSAA